MNNTQYNLVVLNEYPSIKRIIYFQIVRILINVTDLPFHLIFM